MANQNGVAPIIVKRIKKVAGGHHGGSWKVAYADFVTAMMAFFLLMWLINTLPGDKKEGVAKYFKAPGSEENAAGGSGSVKSSGVIDDRQDIQKGIASTEKEALDKARATAEDKQRLEQLKETIEKAIKANPALAQFKDQLIMDMTSEGLRLQLVDKENRPMFDLGGADVKPYMRTMLREIAKTLGGIPNKVSITGHTDAAQYIGRPGYSNWELSADRANAARREMMEIGYPVNKIARVVGLSSTVLYKADKPYDPMNRRTGIVVLTQEAAERMLKEETGQASSPELLKNAASIMAETNKSLKSTIVRDVNTPSISVTPNHSPITPVK